MFIVIFALHSSGAGQVEAFVSWHFQHIAL
jgi:hypothetical protein